MTKNSNNQLSSKTQAESITSVENMIAIKSINKNMTMCCCTPLNWPEYLYHIE